MVIFRENTEDIYAGIEYAADGPIAKGLDFIADFPRSSKRSVSARPGEGWQKQLEGLGRAEARSRASSRHRHQAGQLISARCAGAPRIGYAIQH
jgi:hypothetical protein